MEWTIRQAAWIDEASEPAIALLRIAITSVKAPADPRPYGGPQQQLGETISAWFERLRTWVETCTGQDLDPGHRMFNAEIVGAGLTFLGPAPQNGVGIRISTPRIQPVGERDWGQILTNIRAGADPNVELILYRDASAAALRGFHRRAVIDAAASVEIPLGRLLADHAELLPRRQQESLARHPGLGGLVGIARRSALELSVSFDELERLARYHNDAVHRAEEPDYMTLIGLLGTARRFLESRPSQLASGGSPTT